MIMNVMRFNNNLKAPALISGTAPVPEPKAGEILVRVHAAGVTPTELLWYPTSHSSAGGPRVGAIPGHEFSGVVERTGSSVDASWLGREVYGMNDWFADGASAEYCISTLNSVAMKPARLSHAEAASVPIGALTAWQGLLDRAKLRSGERVLIHGGAGAVGVYAIQLARRTGAYVITTASPRNFEFLSELGANQIFDYHQRFEESVDPVDVVFDLVGAETLKRSWSLLKSNGRMVTIASDSEGTKDERTEKAFFIVEPNHQQLMDIAGLLESGELQCFIDATVPVANASEAYSGKLAKRAGRGKVVLSIVD
jgi:NADPH:quinone reductase-like Zn-dependent oxidoreductase